MEKSGKKITDGVLKGVIPVQLKDSVICPLSLIATQPYWDNDWDSRDMTTTTTAHTGEGPHGLGRVPSLWLDELMNVDGGVPLKVGLSGTGSGQPTHRHWRPSSIPSPSSKFLMSHQDSWPQTPM